MGTTPRRRITPTLTAGSPSMTDREGVSTRDLSAGERDVRDAARGADRLNTKTFFQALESVPKSFAAPQDYRGDHNVHVIDQICSEKLTDGRRSSADAHVEFTRSFLGDPQRFGGRVPKPSSETEKL